MLRNLTLCNPTYVLLIIPSSLHLALYNCPRFVSKLTVLLQTFHSLLWYYLNNLRRFPSRKFFALLHELKKMYTICRKCLQTWTVLTCFSDFFVLHSVYFFKRAKISYPNSFPAVIWRKRKTFSIPATTQLYLSCSPKNKCPILKNKTKITILHSKIVLPSVTIFKTLLYPLLAFTTIYSVNLVFML